MAKLRHEVKHTGAHARRLVAFPTPEPPRQSICTYLRHSTTSTGPGGRRFNDNLARVVEERFLSLFLSRNVRTRPREPIIIIIVVLLLSIYNREGRATFFKMFNRPSNSVTHGGGSEFPLLSFSPSRASFRVVSFNGSFSS